MSNIQIIEATPETAIEAYRNPLIIDAYIDSLDLKPRSKETYRKAIAYFFAWVKDREIAQPKRADIIAYKEHLKDTCKATTTASYLTAVRSFFNYLNAEIGYPNIAANIKNPKSQGGHKKDALSIDQAKNILELMPKDTLSEKRDYAIVSLLLHTGLRTIEAERANIEDIRANLGATVMYVWGKGRDTKDEYVKITNTVLTAIEDYLAARRSTGAKIKDQDPLFISVSHRDYGQRLTTRSISRICKHALKAAGYDSPRLTAHSFRHTAVSIPLQAGASIRDVQRMARHASPLTTERYAHDIRRLENAAEDRLEQLLAG